MAKLTRKSYKRKKIAFAAVILGGVALVSSGFAAWVLSSNAKSDVQGGVAVGAVEKGSLKMEISLVGATGEDALNSGKFNFNTKATDTTGRVRAAKDQKPEDSEKLSLSYKVTVKSPIDNFDKLDITMTAKKGDAVIALDSAIKTDGNKYYVSAPDCSKKTITLQADGLSSSLTLANDKITSETEGSLFKKTENLGEEDKTANVTYQYSWTTTYTVAFAWGDLFNKQNPGEYYDSDVAKDIIDVEVETTLNAMHTALDGITYNLNFLASVN